MKHWHKWAVAYAVAGLGTVAWTAYLGSASKPHFTGLGANTGSGFGLAQAFALWPLAAYQNLTK